MREGEGPRLPCASVLSVGAVSALGIGAEAYRAAMAGEPARVALGRDEALASAGFLRPIAARAPATLPPATALGGAVFEDRATSLLACAMDQLVRGLDEVRPGWRDERLGIAMGTSSGGMLTAERFFAERAAGSRPEDLARFARSATYFAPMRDVLGAAGLARVPRRTLILAACAASTIAIGFGLRWLDRGACDLVIAGGFDGLSVFVAAGFEALRATTATAPRPFRKGRDGMCLGEGAGLVALVRRGEERGARARAFVTGFGASTDAVHITAPDATGGGLARAAIAALHDAGQATAELVSAHGTATPFNDAMEAKAILAAVPGRPVVHPFKAQIGHTLGAAGVLETLATADALAQQVAPAAAGDGEKDPEADVALLARSEARPMARAVKLSAAFGGANAALVLSAGGHEDRPARPRRPVFVAAGAHVTEADLVALSESTGVPRDRLARLDALCRLGLAAAAALAARAGEGDARGRGHRRGPRPRDPRHERAVRREEARARPHGRRAARVPRDLAERRRGRVRDRLQAHRSELRDGRRPRRRHGGAAGRRRADRRRRRGPHGGRRRGRRRPRRARSPRRRRPRGARPSRAARWPSCSRRTLRARRSISTPRRCTTRARSVTSRCCRGSPRDEACAPHTRSARSARACLGGAWRARSARRWGAPLLGHALPR